MKQTIGNVTIECVLGDIATQTDCDAVVNAANAQLRMGGGVAGAIHRAAGPDLEAECCPLAPIRPGEAVITGGHHLPNKYVIHCLGPVFGRDRPEAKLLADCYRNALLRAEENKVRSVAFCAISTGVFGYPIEAAAEVAFRTIADMVSELKQVSLIRFVLHSKKDAEIHAKVLDRILAKQEN
jgi:O-acetyl-ADP-ribose deacetylase (regulator of RNase III)